MAALETPEAHIGMHAPDFSLPGTDGKTYQLQSLLGEKGTLIMFICNHCPYVQKQIDQMIECANELKAAGIHVIAISSNDAEHYPEDSFENMQAYAAKLHFPFPYLYDETQEVAKAYGAVCTPDFFGFNAELSLQYRGRLSSSWSGIEENPEQELLHAMYDIAQTGTTDRAQHPSIGCSIKWKTAA